MVCNLIRVVRLFVSFLFVVCNFFRIYVFPAIFPSKISYKCVCVVTMWILLLLREHIHRPASKSHVVYLWNIGKKNIETHTHKLRTSSNIIVSVSSPPPSPSSQSCIFVIWNARNSTKLWKSVMHVPCQCKTYIFILRNAHKICTQSSNSSSKRYAVLLDTMFLVWQLSSTAATAVADASECQSKCVCERTCKCTRIAIKLQTLFCCHMDGIFRLESICIALFGLFVNDSNHDDDDNGSDWNVFKLLADVCLCVEIFTTLANAIPFKSCRVPTDTPCTLPSRNGKWITKNSFEK